ncbi:MAG: hypothetical protein FDX21_00070 [Chlorobium sp.]|nr:MAG: hypothetical protein FDX21_00070 [Chlorobium sp.]
MDDDIIYSAPPSKSDEELEKGFVTAIIDQPKLLDELAKQLVTLGLAIPGLYATVLKFIGGDAAVAKSSGLIIGAFVCWFIVLALSLFSLTPRKWPVDRSKLRSNTPAATGQPLSIEEFFKATATYKRRLLVASTLFCFAGICLAGLTIFCTTK